MTPETSEIRRLPPRHHTGVRGFLARWCEDRRKLKAKSPRTGIDSQSAPALLLAHSPPTEPTPESAVSAPCPTGADNGAELDHAMCVDNVPASIQAAKFVAYFSDSLFDIEKAAAAGIVFTSYDDMGVHRFWECRRTGRIYAEVLSFVVQEAYTEFCAHEFQYEHPWQTFAWHLNEELQAKGAARKPYTPVKCDETGETHKLRCYRFPVPRDAMEGDRWRERQVA